MLSPPAWGAAKARLGAREQDGANVLKASRVGTLAHCVDSSREPLKTHPAPQRVPKKPPTADFLCFPKQIVGFPRVTRGDMAGKSVPWVGGWGGGGPELREIRY